MEKTLDYAEIDRLLDPLYRLDKFGRGDVLNTYNKISLEIFKLVHQSSLTFQDIERGLRRNNCWTHLIARKRNKNHTSNVVFKIHETVKEYFLFVSYREEKMTIQEVLSESESYNKNFCKLTDTGCQTLVQPSMGVIKSFNKGASVILPRDIALHRN